MENIHSQPRDSYVKNITFYSRFEADIIAGRKTITLRDKSDADYVPGDKVRVARYEDNQFFCDITVKSVKPINYDCLDESHARQENMTLPELKAVIADIYPGITELYMIEFERC
ncbi:N(4)-acetylcytidine aminohydrolase [Prodigiosinella confusarubida]|uniref:N(4)-acetylcytidine aminohydrolase n=1 Tax=Serratia sp. (strain ATCC 39006) TaxID=104623 RepID=UPI003A5BFB82